MVFDFSGKVAVVTGAAKGIGRDLSERLIKAGARVLITDVDEAAGAATARELAGPDRRAAFVRLDMASAVEPLEIPRAAEKEFGRLDYLVNNAGICPINSIEGITVQEWDLVLDVDLRGVFLASQAVTPVLKRQKSGGILNMSSVAGKTGGFAAGAHYAAAKAGVISLTKTFAKELAPYGVRVNAVAPGPVDTPMTQAMTQAVRDHMSSVSILPGMANTADIAFASLFLLSDMARHITGEILDVNGGAVMD